MRRERSIKTVNHTSSLWTSTALNLDPRVGYNELVPEQNLPF